MPCLSYTVHPTPRIKNIFGIFYVFFFISRRAYIYVYLPPPARVRTLFTYTRSLHAVRHLNSRQAIHAKPTRRQASKQPSGYTLRLRHTRNIRYAHTHNSKSNFFIRKCSLNLRISKKCSIFAPNLQVAWK